MQILSDPYPIRKALEAFPSLLHLVSWRTYSFHLLLTLLPAFPGLFQHQPSAHHLSLAKHPGPCFYKYGWSFLGFLHYQAVMTVTLLQFTGALFPNDLCVPRLRRTQNKSLMGIAVGMKEHVFLLKLRIFQNLAKFIVKKDFSP